MRLNNMQTRITKATCDPSLNESSLWRISLSIALNGVWLYRGPALFLSLSQPSQTDRRTSLHFLWKLPDLRKRLQHVQRCTSPFRSIASCGTCKQPVLF